MEFGSQYDIAGFISDLGLPLEDIAGLYSELVAEIRSDIAQLKVLLNDRNWDAVRVIIHNIKGISVNYRISDVYEQASLINQHLKEGPDSDIAVELTDFFRISETACQEITRYFEQNGFPLHTF